MVSSVSVLYQQSHKHDILHSQACQNAGSGPLNMHAALSLLCTTHPNPRTAHSAIICPSVREPDGELMLHVLTPALLQAASAWPPVHMHAHALELICCLQTLLSSEASRAHVHPHKNMNADPGQHPLSPAYGLLYVHGSNCIILAWQCDSLSLRAGKLCL